MNCLFCFPRTGRSVETVRNNCTPWWFLRNINISSNRSVMGSSKFELRSIWLKIFTCFCYRENTEIRRQLNCPFCFPPLERGVETVCNNCIPWWRFLSEINIISNLSDFQIIWARIEKKKLYLIQCFYLSLLSSLIHRSLNCLCCFPRAGGGVETVRNNCTPWWWCPLFRYRLRDPSSQESRVPLRSLVKPSSAGPLGRGWWCGLR